MPLMFLPPETVAKFEQLGAALGIEPELVPQAGVALLEWYAEQRRDGFELLLGLRDDPNEPDMMRLFRVPELRLIDMNENGVKDHGTLP